MCVDMHVTLPTVQAFLMMYPLRCGCTIILIWTMFRSFFCIFFFVVCILEAFVNRTTVFGSLFIRNYSKAWNDDNLFHIFYSYITMVIAESFLFVFCCYLAIGIYTGTSRLLGEYLLCRIVTWLTELVAVFVLALVHKLLIGWYLVMLLFIILEFYGFVIVYSYYMELYDEEKMEAGESCKTRYELSECSPSS